MSLLIDILSAGVVDQSGEALDSGLVYVYELGTTSKVDLFSDPDLSVPVLNPLTLDSAGKAEIYVNSPVRLYIEDSEGNIIDDIDSVGEVASLAGDVTIGTDSSNFLQINSRIRSDLDPVTPDTYDIGDSVNRWNEIHVKTAEVETGNIETANITEDLDVDAPADFSDDITIAGGDYDVSEDFANEVIDEYERETGTTVGVRGVAISDLSPESHYQTASAFTDVDNLEVDITTSGRPVVCFLSSEEVTATPDNIDSTIAAGNDTGRPYIHVRIRILRDSTVIGQTHLHADLTDADNQSFGHAVGGIHYIDTPSAGGPYTYKVQAALPDASYVAIRKAKLVVYEL